MTDEIKQLSRHQRNAFVALCDYASRGGWCWDLHCAILGGHSIFSGALLKIIQGEHPDDDSYWPKEKGNGQAIEEAGKTYGKFYRGETSIDDQDKLISIIKDSKLTDIIAFSKFPDWLGYIGLVLHHCSDQKSRKKLSNILLPQLFGILDDDKVILKYLQEKIAQHDSLDIEDLEKIETSIRSRNTTDKHNNNESNNQI